MDATTLTADLVSTANAITGFAVVQNIAFSYALLKRDLNLKIEGGYQWAMAIVGACWNGTYVWLIWWCSSSALEISLRANPDLALELIQTFNLLAAGKAIAAAFFGFCPVWMIIIYNYKPFWPKSALVEHTSERHDA